MTKMFICYNCEKLLRNKKSKTIPRKNGGVNHICIKCYGNLKGDEK